MKSLKRWHDSLEVLLMAKAQKTVSVRLDAEDYNFLNSLAEADKRISLQPFAP
jgi:DNA-directed RNA polymerase subunit L